MPRASHPRAKVVGERVHVDICGPVGATTLQAKQYFILFKDEYSTFRWIYLMKSKDQAYDFLMKCVNEIEAEHDYKVKKLVSDR